MFTEIGLWDNKKKNGLVLHTEDMEMREKRWQETERKGQWGKRTNGGFSITDPYKNDRLCGLVVRVLGYRSGGPGSIPGTTRKKKNSGSGMGSTQPHEYN
jgi:hypothetical protein